MANYKLLLTHLFLYLCAWFIKEKCFFKKFCFSKSVKMYHASLWRFEGHL